METLTPGHGISPEAARELLIAISQSTPDEVPPPTAELPKNSAHNNADVTELNGSSSGAEDCRSRLISIADAESPDVIKSLPSSSPPQEAGLIGTAAYSNEGDSVGANGGSSGAEEYNRSKLISISYAVPPDVTFLPSGSLAA